MQFLHLDPLFTPFGPSMAFEAFTFNGGEPHIKIDQPTQLPDAVRITTRVRSFNDMGLLLLAVDALKRMHVPHIELFLPYFPAARQDRLMQPGEPLSVKVIAELINNLQLQKVFVLDPHSDVTPALLNNVQVISNHAFVQEALANHHDFLLVAPDAGAHKKIHALANALNVTQVVECGKNRDVRTGELSGFNVFANDLNGKPCVVVDDICDGGGTFLGVAEALKKHNAGPLTLVVTHGIFSKGVEALSKQYEAIFCTDSFATNNHPKVTQLHCNKSWLA